jgi:hypothetical protein
MDLKWWKAQAWDKGWYLIWWTVILLIARVFLVNPIIEAILSLNKK